VSNLGRCASARRRTSRAPTELRSNTSVPPAAGAIITQPPSCDTNLPARVRTPSAPRLQPRRVLRTAGPPEPQHTRWTILGAILRCAIRRSVHRCRLPLSCRFSSRRPLSSDHGPTPSIHLSCVLVYRCSATPAQRQRPQSTAGMNRINVTVAVRHCEVHTKRHRRQPGSRSDYG
jgi:hypothetical protein